MDLFIVLEKYIGSMWNIESDGQREGLLIFVESPEMLQVLITTQWVIFLVINFFLNKIKVLNQAIPKIPYRLKIYYFDRLSSNYVKNCKYCLAH
jgi:hypothetical protein